MSIDVRDARDRLNLTQAELGSLLGVTSVTVSRWENGRASPSEYQAGLIGAMLVARRRDPAAVDQAKALMVTAGVIAALAGLLYLATRD